MVTNSGGAVPADPLPSVDYFPGRGGFYIIGNVLRVEVDLPLVIAQDLQIEKPTDEQLNIIHQLFAGSPWGDDLRAGFESQVIVAAANGPTVSYSYVPLDQLAWRYLVLNHTGNGNDAQWFFYAANLVEPWLYSVGHALTSEQGGRGKRVGWGFDHMAVHRQFFGPSRFPSLISPPALDQAAAERLRAAYSAFQGLDRVQHPGVYRSVELLSLFNRLPLANFLDVLALFMVIEMLLTHAPNDRARTP